jgi:alpha-ketoglutaric semialdehyde dehydrogenase
VIGDAMVNHPDVTGVSFTGSQAVGARIAQLCATHLKKVQLEMGGKNPQVILDDADLAQAVELSVQGAYFSTGQRCTASSRLIVTEGIYAAYIAAMKTRLASLKVGDALQAGIDIGPVASLAQLEQDQRYLEIAQAEGGTLAMGGERLERATQGYFMAPALITDTTSGMRINQEEVFGPVASVVRVKDYEEALTVANDTPFGLSAGIATTSLKHATHFKRHSQAGMVMVNLPTAGVDYHVPFGGRKGSSYGPREQGSYAQEFFTTVKTAYVGV